MFTNLNPYFILTFSCLPQFEKYFQIFIVQNNSSMLVGAVLW